MNLRLLLSNKHTSGAAIVYFIAKIVAELGAVWFPAHKAQFDSTTNVIEAAAVGWGLLSAGDAKQSAPAEPPAKGADNPISSTPTEPKP
jgi:hypothetical protein